MPSPYDPNNLDPRFPNNPPFQGERDATKLAREMADVTTQLNEQAQPLLSILQQMQGVFAASEGHVSKIADHLERVAKVQTNINKQTKEGSRTQARVAKDTEKQAAARKKILELEQKGNKALKEEMRHHDLVDKKGYLLPGTTRTPTRRVSEAEATEILSRPRSNRERQRLVGALRDKMASEKESPQFKPSEFIGKLMHGDIGGAIGEAGQKSKLATKAEAAMAHAGVTRGGFAGAALLRLAPLVGALGRPAALIAVQQALTRGMRQVNASRELGAVTGGGFAEGNRARLSALGAGINPFDMLSVGEAQQAQRAAREAGYSGGKANRVSDVITDLRQDLGIPIKESADLVVTSMRDVGMTTDQVRAQMSGLDDATRSAHTSITQLVGAIQTSMNTLKQFGEAPAAAVEPTTTGIMHQFAGTLLAQKPELINQFVTGEARKLIALQSGFRIDQIYSPEFSRNFQTYFTSVLKKLADAKPKGMGMGIYVRMGMQTPFWQELFGPTPWQTIQDMLEEVSKKGGGTFGTEQRVNQAQRATQSAKSAFDARLDKIATKQLNKTISFDAADLQYKRANQTAITSMRDAAISAGLNPNQRQAVLAPLREALKRGGGRDAIDKAFLESQKIFEDKARTVKVEVGLHPNAKNVLYVSSQWPEVMKAQRQAQGITRPGGG